MLAVTLLRRRSLAQIRSSAQIKSLQACFDVCGKLSCCRMLQAEKVGTSFDRHEILGDGQVQRTIRILDLSILIRLPHRSALPANTIESIFERRLSDQEADVILPQRSRTMSVSSPLIEAWRLSYFTTTP
jgi:hypothetical protein